MKVLAGLILAVAVVSVAAAQSGQQMPSSNAKQGATTHPTQEPGVNNATATSPVIAGHNETEAAALRGASRIAREVRHELLMLPYYTLFDDLRFRVNGDTVELLGDVVNPTLKTDAERAVKDIEGVERVVNHINVLSPSPADARIREQVARAVFGTGGLSRYGWEAAPSIHIIVNGGRVKLAGVVGSQSDKTLAGVAANQVPGVFSVTNDLVIEGQVTK